MSARIAKESNPEIMAGDMRIGQIGTFFYGDERVIGLRVYNMVVDLNAPYRTWLLPTCNTLKLVPLPPGSTVEVVAE